MAGSEAELLNRISLARGTSESEKSAPTDENLEAVDVSGDEIPAKDEVVEEAASEVQTEETPSESLAEEDEGEGGTEAQADDEGEDFYVEYQGREINLKDIVEWEKGHLRQSDYTRKTQELSEQRKGDDEARVRLDEQRSTLSESILTLEAIIAEESISDEALADMREYEPQDYIAHQEKQKSRQDALAKAKDIQPASDTNVDAEREKLWNDNPAWLDNGKQTDAFRTDMKLLTDYAKDSGYSDQEIAGIQSAHHWKTMIDAAKYREISKKNSSIEKRVRKAPVTTKPRAATVSNLQDKLKTAEARLKKTGRTEDAVKVRQLKRKIQG